MEYKTFKVFYRNIEEKIGSKTFYVSLYDLDLYGIEKFYDDVQAVFEKKYNYNLCFLKIGTQIIIADLCGFAGSPKGTQIKTTKKEIHDKEFYNKYGWEL